MNDVNLVIILSSYINYPPSTHTRTLSQPLSLSLPPFMSLTLLYLYCDECEHNDDFKFTLWLHLDAFGLPTSINTCKFRFQICVAMRWGDERSRRP